MTGWRVSLKVLAVVLLVALVIVPAVAGRAITTAGTNVFVGEENLDFTGGDFTGTTQLVHYTGKVGESSIDKTIMLSAGKADLTGGIPTGSYYAIGSLHPTVTYVNVQFPEVKLDVVLSNSRSDSVNGKSVTRNIILDFKLMNNLNGLPNGVMNIEVTLPDGRKTTQFGGQALNNIPVSGYTVYKGAIVLTDVSPGIYIAVAKWPSTSDFYGKGFDSASVAFEVVAPITAIPTTPLAIPTTPPAIPTTPPAIPTTPPAIPTTPPAIPTTAPTTPLIPPSTPLPRLSGDSGSNTSSGSLDISSTPSGASVYVDSTYKGVTPTVVPGLSAGLHQVKVTRSGYYDYTQAISVTTGRTTTVSAILSSIPRVPVTGSLAFKSTPSGANIYIDSIYMGVTPVLISELPEGSYQVRLAKSGYDDYTRTASVTAGEITAISAPLISKSIYPTEPLSVTAPTEPLSIVALLGLNPAREPFTTLWWLPIVAIVLLVGGFIYARKRRSAQAGGSGIDTAQSSGSPAGQGEKTLAGRADVLVQKRSSLSSKRLDPAVVLPDEGFTPSTAKPDLTITLSHTTIYTDEWDKIGLTLANTGTASALGITLTFSDDVETRLLRPVDLAVGGSTTIEAGIRPRTRGNIPLEITARYRDAGNQTYKQVASFWLSVEPRGVSSLAGSPIPPSISRPVTPKSLPSEMTERYIAAEYLGKGGFARVFKVQKSDGSWAALKIPISLDAATGKSFIAELHNWTSMVHENIVRVNDYNIMPFPYFEMELCDGTLATLERPIPPDHAAWLIFNIGEGLKYAHDHGILHRDLKPQNIMLRDGIPKITDWGLSKVMTQSGTTTISGGFTAYYAAPEQITNKPKDQRTDIWQLGVIAYELVTGRLPFTGESMVEIGMAIATKVPERPGAVYPDAEPLDAIILKCLEKDPGKRYQSVAALQKDLAAYLKLNYVASLKESIQVNDLQRSAYYCGDLVLISLKIGDLVSAYKYAADIARYSTGEAQTQALELAQQIKARVEMGAQELPDELIQKAEVIVHRVRVR